MLGTSTLEEGVDEMNETPLGCSGQTALRREQCVVLPKSRTMEHISAFIAGQRITFSRQRNEMQRGPQKAYLRGLNGPDKQLSSRSCREQWK
jgi:hypothetical protein